MVIVGGGVIGTSAAFHLAEAGVDVVLIERAELASGFTSRAAGGVRAQFSDALNIQIAQRSLEAFRRFGTRPGWEIDFKRSGYLFVLSREADVSEFEAGVTLQNRHGVPSRMLSSDEARALCPLLAGDDILRRSPPEDGHVTPEAVVQGYAFAARALGAHVRVGARSPASQTDGEQIIAVGTRHGTIATNVVICAAGAWSRACGEMVGEALPVTPLRRQILFTEPMADLAPDLPFTIDFSSSFYFHREGPGLLMGCPTPRSSQGSRWRRPTTGSRTYSTSPLAGRLASPRPASRAAGPGCTRYARPQRDHRRIRARQPLPLRHRLLGPRVPTGPGGGGDPARPRPRALALRRHRAAQRQPLQRCHAASRVQHCLCRPPHRDGPRLHDRARPAGRRGATAAVRVVEALERLGVSVAFGLPGVHNLAIWKALSASPIRLVGVRHEQAAVYAADGYARATGRLGVAVVTTGPGAANTLGATGEAMASGSPGPCHRHRHPRRHPAPGHVSRQPARDP